MGVIERRRRGKTGRARALFSRTAVVCKAHPTTPPAFPFIPRHATQHNPKQQHNTTDKLETLKILASHHYTKDKAVAAEVSRPLKGGDVQFTLGVQHRLENGSLFKAKVNQTGLASLLYEQRLASGERLALSTQLDTINIGAKAPKVGVALDLA